MKKRLFTLLLALCLIPVLAGCVRMDTTMKVNVNKTVDVRMMFAFNKEMLSSMSGDEDPLGMSEEDLEKMKTEGYTYEAYAQDGFTGYVLSKKGIDINAFDGGDESLEKLVGGVSIKVDGDHVTVSVAPGNEAFAEGGEMLGQLKDFGGYMKFNLEIPSKATKHNATSVSRGDKLLTWDLTSMKSGDTIYAEFDLKEGAPSWLLPVIIGAVALVAIAAVALLLLRKKKGQEPSETIETVCEGAREKVETVKDAVEEKAETVKDAVEEKVETVKDAVEEKVETVKDAVEEKVETVKDTVEEKVETVKDAIEEKFNND